MTMEIRKLRPGDDLFAVSRVYEEGWRAAYRGLLPQDYLDSIPAGGTKDISIELNARADLVQKPYSISMSMKYEDSAAAQYEAQSSLAIPVRQEARFEFSKMQIAPDTVSVVEEVNISCSQ